MANRITAYEIHKIFACNLAHEDNILWDAYPYDENAGANNQYSLFKKKINELIRGPKPTEKGYQAVKKIREAIYDSTKAQAKYTNKNLLASFTIVTVSEDSPGIGPAMATKFSTHLLIRTRKCMRNDDSTNCCMVFIDETGNVYRNWKHFIETNSLPKGNMLAPPQGVYRFRNEKLILNSWPTPASKLVNRTVETTDLVAGAGGLAASGGIMAAAALPVIAPAVPLLAAVAVTTGIYSSVRSACNLYSLKDHEKSLSISNPSARGSWIGVASGVAAVSAPFARKSLARLAMAGKEVSTVRKVVVNGMNISTMFLSGTGVANGVIDLILRKLDDEEIKAVDGLQLAASLVVFTHSAYNFRLASTIVSQAQDVKVNDYRRELSNRQRKMFDKLTKETIRTQGTSKGKMDLIRLINEVPDNKYLNDLNKINKDLNKKNIRFNAGKNGQILLNDEIQVKTSDLRNNIQHGVGENILEKVNQPIPDAHPTIPNQEIVNILTDKAFSQDFQELIYYFEIGLKIAVPIINSESLQDCIRALILKVGEEVATFLIKKAQEFYDWYGSKLEQILKTSLILEKLLWDLYIQCEKHIRDLTIYSIEKNVEFIFSCLLSAYEKMSFVNPRIQKIKCDVCQGFYQICPI